MPLLIWNDFKKNTVILQIQAACEMCPFPMSEKVILWLQYHRSIGCTDIFMAQPPRQLLLRIVQLADSEGRRN